MKVQHHTKSLTFAVCVAENLIRSFLSMCFSVSLKANVATSVQDTPSNQQATRPTLTTSNILTVNTLFVFVACIVAALIFVAVLSSKRAAAAALRAQRSASQCDDQLVDLESGLDYCVIAISAEDVVTAESAMIVSPVGGGHVPGRRIEVKQKQSSMCECTLDVGDDDRDSAAAALTTTELLIRHFERQTIGDDHSSDSAADVIISDGQDAANDVDEQAGSGAPQAWSVAPEPVVDSGVHGEEIHAAADDQVDGAREADAAVAIDGAAATAKAAADDDDGAPEAEYAEAIADEHAAAGSFGADATAASDVEDGEGCEIGEPTITPESTGEDPSAAEIAEANVATESGCEANEVESRSYNARCFEMVREISAILDEIKSDIVSAPQRTDDEETAAEAREDDVVAKSEGDEKEGEREVEQDDCETPGSRHHSITSSSENESIELDTVADSSSTSNAASDDSDLETDEPQHEPAAEIDHEAASAAAAGELEDPHTRALRAANRDLSC